MDGAMLERKTIWPWNVSLERLISESIGTG